jgi:hypothetical protein
MSNLIQFLHSAGRGPRNLAALGTSYEDVVARLEIEEAQKRALIARDTALLNELLGGRPVMYCSQYSPGPKPPKRELPTPDSVPQHEEKPEEEPDDDEAQDTSSDGASDQ